MTDDPSEDAMPAWSRDGRWIYFWSQRTGSSQIWKIPSQGGPAVQVTTHGGLDAFESSDGYLYYGKERRKGVSSGKQKEDGVWRVPVGGGREEPVLEHRARLRNTRAAGPSWAMASIS